MLSWDTVLLTNPCSFCAARVLLRGPSLANLGREFVQVPLRFFLAVEERLEICLRGCQRLHPHGRPSIRVSKALGFFNGVLDGVVENRLRFWGILAFLIVSKPRLFLFFASSSGSLHGLSGGISFRP